MINRKTFYLDRWVKLIYSKEREFWNEFERQKEEEEAYNFVRFVFPDNIF